LNVLLLDGLVRVGPVSVKKSRMSTDQPWIVPCELQLEGGRARLVPLEPGHAADLFETSRDPAVWQYATENPSTVDEMRSLIDAARSASPGEVAFAIIDTACGRAVGSTRYIEILPRHKALEIGWTWIGTEWQRTSINTECKYLLLRHAFEVCGAGRVQLKADLRNTRSLAAIERIGAVREGVLRRHRVLADGFVRDSVYYSIVADEWPAARERLEYLLRGPSGGSHR
jgi:RimJ/RimL family protein N-acetyltransferase